MVAPLLQAQIDIDAPPEKVWALISDLRRMPEWSPQCRWMRPFGQLRPGARTLNFNRRNRLFWPTTCTIVDVVPNKRLAFKVNTNHTVWTYELEPNGEGTRVTESRHAENGVTAVSNLTVNALLGGTTNFERELVEGMQASLAKIKAAAEKN
ncbi:polyketide cyclase [Mycobacterium intermedium]|uniref:Polyketide cyclase n=1 Tax=Mycobacterium intermedium TaxID=28445 RepID=A0A1E3S9W5_MYCIE|nr:SRPBCC family protein [Mycobacterium intermedium]MCV6967801.1 SRPBCC family protein [Mycobacterium intermedium]ODQ98367.1 polyketide cyclase [Mycobacterium intermedium]OPE50849.1 polyketide cyclase [Mycobacterium intermedium]ORB06572.1 polyketide cyclase [Mycobacterium intermedium]